MEKVLDDICQIVMPPFVGLANDVEITGMLWAVRPGCGVVPKPAPTPVGTVTVRNRSAQPASTCTAVVTSAPPR